MEDLFTLNPEIFNKPGTTVVQLVVLSIVFGFSVRLLFRYINSIYIKLEPDSVASSHDNKLTKKLSFLNGTFEVLMYSFSILINLPIFIAFWIGAKTASRWDLIRKEKGDDRQFYTDTKFMYLRFLMGNALNIIGSYIIAVIINKGIIGFLPS